MYKFIETTLKDSETLFRAYLNSITGTNDDFWEEHLLAGKAYQISVEDQIIGITLIYDNENMTCFYIKDAHIRHAQPAFLAALDVFKPEYAFVPTNDELFLSLCMDVHQSIEKQAYFFVQGKAAVRPPEFPRALLTLAKPEDEADILDTENVAENIRLGKYFVLRENGTFLGQGFFNRGTLVPHTASIGMSIHPAHRRKGVGRSIIMHLSELCHENGIKPVCGCWYYNHNSKRTLESAGFITKTRLLKVWFKKKEEAGDEYN